MFPFILLAPGLKLLVQKGNGEIGLCCTRSLEKLGPGDLSGQQAYGSFQGSLLSSSKSSHIVPSECF